ncbi:MAG: GIY-YIG nuclease family protein [Flavobacteriales bacterium]|nr:GIY-YIG nuclease family protein [Bacteroidota bacterium]MCB9240044.1 GIY-YIG nuclease family protein [Flavobacteriales bacterium]
MAKKGWVYILTNETNKVLYIGVSSSLKSRIQQHKNNKYPGGFTSRYKCHKLVYIEQWPTIERAIAREKQLKKGPRIKKVRLIEKMNPFWEDLFPNDQK